MTTTERFLTYIKYGTASDEASASHPSTAGQLVLAEKVKNDLIALGYKASADKNGYVYCIIPATDGYEGKTKIGFIAHLDTSPDAPGDNVEPQIIENYDGGPVVLGTSGRVISPDIFPHLASLKGRTLITTDGNTLLGADDKAGVAEIVTLCERLKSFPHGQVSVAFTPDEEIGQGADLFDVGKFGAEFAYTVDGDTEGGVEYENFNAAAAKIVFKGFSVHPGTSKNTMINASLVAMEFNSMLPSADIPSMTEGYEGFFHLTDMKGDVSDAELCYIIRDHSAESFTCRLNTLEHITKIINEKYGDGTAELSVREQYRNMAEIINQHPELVKTAVESSEKAGVKAIISPIRGGTDGARLSFMGLPCPNLGTGGHAYHGQYEHITVEGMNAVTDILENIVKKFAE